MKTDLYDTVEDMLIEAKADASRNSVRLAIGQLLDYRRFIPSIKRLAVLLPDGPSEDLTSLLRELDITLIFQTEDGLEST